MHLRGGQAGQGARGTGAARQSGINASIAALADSNSLSDGDERQPGGRDFKKWSRRVP